MDAYHMTPREEGGGLNPQGKTLPKARDTVIS